MPLDRDGLIVPIPQRQPSDTERFAHDVMRTTAIIHARLRQTETEQRVTLAALMRLAAVNIVDIGGFENWQDTRREGMRLFGEALDEARAIFERAVNTANDEGRIDE